MSNDDDRPRRFQSYADSSRRQVEAELPSWWPIIFAVGAVAVVVAFVQSAFGWIGVGVGAVLAAVAGYTAWRGWLGEQN